MRKEHKKKKMKAPEAKSKIYEQNDKNSVY